MLKQLIESLESLSITHGDTTKKISAYDAAVMAKGLNEASNEQKEVIARVAMTSFSHFTKLTEAMAKKEDITIELPKKDDKEKSEKEVMKDKLDTMKEEIKALEEAIKDMKKDDDIEDVSRLPDAEKETFKTINKDVKADKEENLDEADSYNTKSDPTAGVRAIKKIQAAPKMGNASGPNRSNPNKPVPTKPVVKEDEKELEENPTPEQRAAAMKRAAMRMSSAQNDPRAKHDMHRAPAKPAVAKPSVVKEDDAKGVTVTKDNDDQLDINSLSTIDLAQNGGEVEKDTTVPARNPGDKEMKKVKIEDMVTKVSNALKGGKNPFTSGPFGRDK